MNMFLLVELGRMRGYCIREVFVTTLEDEPRDAARPSDPTRVPLVPLILPFRNFVLEPHHLSSTVSYACVGFAKIVVRISLLLVGLCALFLEAQNGLLLSGDRGSGSLGEFVESKRFRCK